jgi:vacuolar-type H+-ATPase subunit B/Vma2
MRLMDIGRWSDRSATLVDHVRQVMRCAETSEISGDEEMPLLGRRVCESAFRTQVTVIDGCNDVVTTSSGPLTRSGGEPSSMMGVGIAKKDRIRVGQVKEGREVRFVTRGTGGGRGNIKIKDINRGTIQNNSYSQNF